MKNLSALIYKILGILLILFTIVFGILIIFNSLNLDIIFDLLGIFSLVLPFYLLILGISCLFFGFEKLQINKNSDWSIILFFIGSIVLLIGILLVIYNSHLVSGDGNYLGEIIILFPIFLWFISFIFLIIGILKGRINN